MAWRKTATRQSSRRLTVAPPMCSQLHWSKSKLSRSSSRWVILSSTFVSLPIAALRLNQPRTLSCPKGQNGASVLIKLVPHMVKYLEEFCMRLANVVPQESIGRLQFESLKPESCSCPHNLVLELEQSIALVRYSSDCLKYCKLYI